MSGLPSLLPGSSSFLKNWYEKDNVTVATGICHELQQVRNI